MTSTLLIDLISEQRVLISNLCTFFGTPGIVPPKLAVQLDSFGFLWLRRSACMDFLLPVIGKQCHCWSRTVKFGTYLCLSKSYPCTKFGCQSLIHDATMTSSLFLTTLSIILHVCKLSIVSCFPHFASVFIWFFFEMLECCSLHFNQKIANCVIQLSNFELKKARKIIRILYFLSNADVSNKFAKFQSFDKKDDKQYVFFTQLKLNIPETRKSKNWKVRDKYSENVPASHKSDHAAFLKSN